MHTMFHTGSTQNYSDTRREATIKWEAHGGTLDMSMHEEAVVFTCQKSEMFFHY